VKRYAIDKLRNLVFASHGGAGKTTLSEALLHVGGAINRRGTVAEGNTVSDYDPEEIKRQISINTSLIPVEWQDHKLNILDTPGYFDFVGEVLSATRVVEGAVIIVCAAAGVEVGTEKVIGYCNQAGLPRLIFINKMDRENANFEQVLGQVQKLCGVKAVPLLLPVGNAEAHQGVVDLIRMKAYLLDKSGKVAESEIPADLLDEAETSRLALVEAIAATDDELTEKFLEDQPLTEEEMLRGLSAGVKAGDIVPVLCGSAEKETGIIQLMDYIIHCLPSPADVGPLSVVDVKSGENTELVPSEQGPVAAQVFKTMADPYVGKMNIFRVYSGVVKSDTVIFNANQGKDERLGQLFFMRGKEHVFVSEVSAGDIAGVAKLQVTTTGDTLCAKDKPIRFPLIELPKPKISMAAVPQAKGDEEKISSGLARLSEEDPTFVVEKNPITNELLISGIGELHMEVMVSRLSKKFGVTAVLKDPQVPYRETIKGKAKADYRHKKQSGGRGQYGHVIIEIEPLPTGEGFDFVDKIFGGAVPKQYIPAVEKGIRETMAEGILAGYPVVDVRVTLVDGSYHDVDSSEMAFKIASSMAFKKGFSEANPILLEPIYTITVEVPDAYMGDVIGDLNKKRGRILGMDPVNGLQRIRALVPLAEVFRYAIDLRSMTQGRGDFTLEFDHYEEVPAHIAEQVIEAARKAKEQES